MCGLIIGMLLPAVLATIQACEYRRQMADTVICPTYLGAVWLVLSDRERLPGLSGIAAVGATSGAIGAWAGYRKGRHPIGPVLWFALIPLLLPLVVYAKNPAGGSKEWGGALCVAAIIIPFVWMAGRVGQELGALQRRSK